jgi:hypothetical protein
MHGGVCALVGDGGFEVVQDFVRLRLIVVLHLVPVVAREGAAVDAGVPARGACCRPSATADMKHPQTFLLSSVACIQPRDKAAERGRLSLLQQQITCHRVSMQMAMHAVRRAGGTHTS